MNSEFEVLTGMNIDDFGIGEYPYKTIVKETACESLAYDLKPYGYQAFAIHNNTGDFYDRNLVYPNLGFDTFTSVEYMWPDNYTPMGWAKGFRPDQMRSRPPWTATEQPGLSSLRSLYRDMAAIRRTPV